MMKLSFTTLGCPDWSFNKILAEAKSLGFTGIEIRGVDGKMRAEEISLFFPENAENTKRLFREKGLTVVGFGTSVKFHDDAAFDASLEEGRLAIDVCFRMGIPFVRVFGDQVSGISKLNHVTGQAAKGIRTLCEYARGKNVKVLLEIHGDFNRLDTVMPVVEQVKDCPEFGILWDIEHSDKIYGDNWLEFYKSVKPWVRHVHVKDHKRKDGLFELCLTGEGDIPITEIIKTLWNDGYDGWYSLEWEKKWHPELPEPDIALPGYIDFMSRV